MSISIIQKSDLTRPKRNPKIALVLAGGAISGGAFKLGGLVALDRFLKNRKVIDFDTYVGVSAGAFIGSFLAGGLPPEELLKGIDGTSLRIDQLKYYDFYWPAYAEWARRTGMLVGDAVTIWPRVAAALVRRVSLAREETRRSVAEFFANPSYKTAENIIGPVVAHALQATKIPHASHYLPAGIFDNSRIERYVRVNLTRNHIPNDFRLLHRERGVALYITATNLNTARGVVFGHDADHTVSISEACQASTAIPLFYLPARVHGEEYLDALVRKTANASLAMHKGADLIIAYNPFRPFMNRNRYQLTPTASSLSDLGMGVILNQTIRTLLQTRLYLGLEKLRFDPSFHGDLILIEPTETDARFFSMNPLAFWNRRDAAQRGYISVKQSLEQNCSELQRILAAHGIECGVSGMPDELETAAEGSMPETAAPARHAPRRKAQLRVVK